MSACPHCSNASTHKDGRDRAGKQRYHCSACGRSFSDRTGTPFTHHRWPREVMVMDVSRQTVAAWVQKFGALLVGAARRYAKRVGSRWFVDETYVRIGKRWAYLYCGVAPI